MLSPSKTNTAVCSAVRCTFSASFMFSSSAVAWGLYVKKFIIGATDGGGNTAAVSQLITFRHTDPKICLLMLVCVSEWVV